MDNKNNPPFFISAESPEKLRFMMLANNRRHARRFHYFDIQFASGKWYAWFEIAQKDLTSGD